MSNPLEDFLEEYGEKKASKEDYLGSLGSGILHGLGGMAAAGVVGGVGAAASKIYRAATKARDFRSMLDFNQDLQEHHERDPRLFNQMFTSLRTMNPTFSSDPLVAGTYMRRMLESPSTAGGILTEAVGTREKFHGPFSQAVDAGMSAARSPFGKKP